MRRKGFEPPTYWFVASYSIQLSYRRISLSGFVPQASIIIAQAVGFVKHFFQNLAKNLIKGWGFSFFRRKMRQSDTKSVQKALYNSFAL